MDRFYASWLDGKRAKARKLHKLTGFVEFCVKRKWLKEDITADVEPPEGHSIPANKSPFTNDGCRFLPSIDGNSHLPEKPTNRPSDYKGVFITNPVSEAQPTFNECFVPVLTN